MTERNDGVSLVATAGLFAAWAVHDAEEWFTIGPWARSRGLPVSDATARTAIGVMGGVVGYAAYDGVRTGGESDLYQAALLAYGLHGLTHLGTAAVVRGYSPGVATTPVAVLAFSWWARGRLARARVDRAVPGLLPRSAALLVGGLFASYAVAVAVTGRGRPARGACGSARRW